MQTDAAAPCGDPWRSAETPTRCSSVETGAVSDMVFSKLPSDMPPYNWSRDDVVCFVRWCQDEFALDDLPKDAFRMNGKALCILTKADICQRTPEAGDVIYNMLQRLIARNKPVPCSDGQGGCRPSSTSTITPPTMTTHATSSNPDAVYCPVLGRDVNVNSKVNLHSIPGPLDLKVSRAGRRKRKHAVADSRRSSCPCNEKCPSGKAGCNVPVLPPGFVCPADCDGKNCDKLIDAYKKKMETDAASSQEANKEAHYDQQFMMQGTQSYFVYPATPGLFTSDGMPILVSDLKKSPATSHDERQEALGRQGGIKHLMSLQKSMSFNGADIYKRSTFSNDKQYKVDDGLRTSDKRRDIKRDVPMTVPENMAVDARQELPTVVARKPVMENTSTEDSVFKRMRLPDAPSVRSFSPLTIPRSPLILPPQPQSPATAHHPRSPYIIPNSHLALPQSPLTAGQPRADTGLDHPASPLLIQGRMAARESSPVENEHPSLIENQHNSTDVEPKLRHYISEKTSQVNKSSAANLLDKLPPRIDEYVPLSQYSIAAPFESVSQVSLQSGNTSTSNPLYPQTRTILPSTLTKGVKSSGVLSPNTGEMYPQKKLMIDEDPVETDEDLDMPRESPMNIFLDGRAPGVLSPSSPVDQSREHGTPRQCSPQKDLPDDLIIKHEVAEVMSKMSGQNQHQDMLKDEADGKLLWEFLCKLLEEPRHYDQVIGWEDQQQRIFRIINTEHLAKLWGAQKQKTDMTYEKLSRSLRYYYRVKIISKVPGRRLTYRFEQNPEDIVKGVRGAKPGVPHRPRGSRQKAKELKRLAKQKCPAQAQTSNDPSHQVFREDHSAQNHGTTVLQRDGDTESRLPLLSISSDGSSEHEKVSGHAIHLRETGSFGSSPVVSSEARPGLESPPIAALVVVDLGGDSFPMVPDSSTSPVSAEQCEGKGHSSSDATEVVPSPASSKADEPAEKSQSVIVLNKAIGLAGTDKETSIKD